ncbi:MAG: hypothetical protein HYU53_04000 [Acidobacteria bacterium]|nr:hypothetical protein [Acidobacteriota bacterium]
MADPRNRSMGQDREERSDSDENVTGRASEGDADEFEDTEDLEKDEEDLNESNR